jgi:hypothetical protein
VILQGSVHQGFHKEVIPEEAFLFPSFHNFWLPHSGHLTVLGIEGFAFLQKSPGNNLPQWGQLTTNLLIYHSSCQFAPYLKRKPPQKRKKGRLRGRIFHHN